MTREFVLQAAIYPTFPYPIVLTSPKTTITVIVPPITDDDGNEVVMAEINGSSHSLTSASIIISKSYHSLTTNIPSSKARPGSIISSNSADTSFTTTYTVSGKTRVAIVFYSVWFALDGTRYTETITSLLDNLSSTLVSNSQVLDNPSSVPTCGSTKTTISSSIAASSRINNSNKAEGSSGGNSKSSMPTSLSVSITDKTSHSNTDWNKTISTSYKNTKRSEISQDKDSKKQTIKTSISPHDSLTSKSIKISATTSYTTVIVIGGITKTVILCPISTKDKNNKPTIIYITNHLKDSDNSVGHFISKFKTENCKCCTDYK